jgi:hypothetical protein
MRVRSPKARFERRIDATVVRRSCACALLVIAIFTSTAVVGAPAANGVGVKPPSCSSFSGVSSLPPVGAAALAGCTDAGSTGGSGLIGGLIILGGSTSITWATASGGTTTITVTANFGTRRDDRDKIPCPAGSTEIADKGTVTASSGTAVSLVAGSRVSFEICAASDGSFGLEPGTKFKF